MEPHNRDALKEEASSTARRDANEATAGDLNAISSVMDAVQDIRMRHRETELMQRGTVDDLEREDLNYATDDMNKETITNV
eukprot:1195889-Prorocentrum_minimum.AAC.1